MPWRICAPDAAPSIAERYFSAGELGAATANAVSRVASELLVEIRRSVPGAAHLGHRVTLGCDLSRGNVVGLNMELSSRAAPGVDRYAEHAVENACRLAATAGIRAATAGPGGWSAAAVDDALEAIDTLAAALSVLGPEAARALAPVTAAVNDVRRLLAPPADEATGAAAGVSAPRMPPRPPRRRGLGPGFKGIHPDP